MKAALLLALMVGGCSTVADTLPASRLVAYTMPVSGDGMHMGAGGAVAQDHGIYIDPRCKANESALWAMQIEEREVPRSDPRLESVNGRADGRYFPPIAGFPASIIIREGLIGWYRDEVRLHERCHHHMQITTGVAQFHR